MMKEHVDICSLGLGVQSSTLALMSAVGELDMPDAAIFADTQREPKNVYEWYEKLVGLLPFPVLKESAGDLYAVSIRVRFGGKTQLPYLSHAVPAYTVNGDFTKGTMFRQCTDTHKLVPIRRAALKLANGKPIVMWIGISIDEAHRMKPSRDSRITHRFPLVERGMSRKDCLMWMDAHGYPAPPRSACTFCPYHSDVEWARLKKDDPESWKEAVRYERDLQAAFKQVPRLTSTPFLHPSRVPLEQVDLSKPDHWQPSLFGNECEGMCGV
jgi:hypothetical protein